MMKKLTHSRFLVLTLCLGGIVAAAMFGSSSLGAKDAGSKVESPPTAPRITAPPASATDGSGTPAAGAGSTLGMGVDTVYDRQALRAEEMVKWEDIIVQGVVSEIIRGRWNTPEGKAWVAVPDEAVAEPVIYTTYLVTPSRVLKTAPGLKVGEPVAFHAKGGIDTASASPGDTAAANAAGMSDNPLGLAVGDQVVMFGEQKWYYGGEVSPDGYTATEASVFVWDESSASFVRLLPSPDGTPVQAALTPETVALALALASAAGKGSE